MKRVRTARLIEETLRKKAGNDPVLEEVLRAHLRYNRGAIDAPTVVDNVKFWCVGHNASHEFYMGTDGTGRRFRRSVGESATEMEDGVPKLDVSPVEEVPNFHGYYGHY